MSSSCPSKQTVIGRIPPVICREWRTLCPMRCVLNTAAHICRLATVCSTEGLLPWEFSVVHLESGSDVVIIEGYFEEISRPARAFFQRLDEELARKYVTYRPSENLPSLTRMAACLPSTHRRSLLGIASRTMLLVGGSRANRDDYVSFSPPVSRNHIP